jgi:hypothetical protein
VALFLGFMFCPFCALSKLIFLWTEDCVSCELPMHCALIHFSTGTYVTHYNWSDSFKALSHESPFSLYHSSWNYDFS